MALTELNKDSIAFKKILGKAHTKTDFQVFEETIATNISLSDSTIFAEPIPPTVAGIENVGDNDGVIEKVRFAVDVIPNTNIAPNTSQGWRLRLPDTYGSSGFLNSEYPNTGLGNEVYLHEQIGRLQLVPQLYGQRVGVSGVNDYRPVLFDQNNQIIDTFDVIDFFIDPYNGVLFIQDPPSNYDTSLDRPAYVEAYLYVGKYLNDILAENGIVTNENTKSFTILGGQNSTGVTLTRAGGEDTYRVQHDFSSIYVQATLLDSNFNTIRVATTRPDANNVDVLFSYELAGSELYYVLLENQPQNTGTSENYTINGGVNGPNVTLTRSGGTDSYAITHTLNSRALDVIVLDVNNDYLQISVDTQRINTNEISVNFGYELLGTEEYLVLLEKIRDSV